MEIPRHWRIKRQRYSLTGEICPHCGKKNFPPRQVCPGCEGNSGRQPDTTTNDQIINNGTEVVLRAPTEVTAVAEVTG